MQVDYLKEMCKPKDWKFGAWFQKINEYLEYMDNDLAKLTVHQIIKDVIQWNLPLYIQMKFIEAEGHQKQTLMEVTTIMKDMEKADAMHSEECKHKEEIN